MRHTVDKAIASNQRAIYELEHELYPAESLSHLDCGICGPGPVKKNIVPSKYPHRFYKIQQWTSAYDYGEDRHEVAAPDAADVVSSEIEGSALHSIMLDVDVRAAMPESSTPGHHHLYIDVPLPWYKYRRFLRACYRAGVIEKGFYKASLQRRATQLRPPWVRK